MAIFISCACPLSKLNLLICWVLVQLTLFNNSNESRRLFLYQASLFFNFTCNHTYSRFYLKNKLQNLIYYLLLINCFSGPTRSTKYFKNKITIHFKLSNSRMCALGLNKNIFNTHDLCAYRRHTEVGFTVG